MSSGTRDESDVSKTKELGKEFETTDSEAKFRTFNVISYFVVLVLIGVPVWWHTTRVYRAVLPLNEMSSIVVPPRTVREASIPLSLEYDVLITLMNPDPAKLEIELNAKDLNANLESFLESVGLIADFTLKSQWLYLQDLGVSLSNNGNYSVITEEQLPYVITPLEKKTWSHMSPRPSLNLVVFFARCDIPIYIRTKDDVSLPSNSFLSPRWGGISIINADGESCKKGIYKPDLRPIISNFLLQLYELLGLKGESENDVRALKIVKTKEMVDSTKRTLKSLAQLLSEINSIVISDDVANKIVLALESADLAETSLNEHYIDAALSAAKIAFKNSEEAFGDPSLLALLYFPDDQKYAVYIPLFLPIMIPVFMSLVVVYKYYVKTKDEEKEKAE